MILNFYNEGELMTDEGRYHYSLELHFIKDNCNWIISHIAAIYLMFRSLLVKNQKVKYIYIYIAYHIYPNKSRAHINAWAQINTGVQRCKVNKRLCKIQKGSVI